MIRGFIDFEKLDRTARLRSSSDQQGLAIPGLQLDFDPASSTLVAEAGQLLLICGKPRPRQADLAARIEHEGPRALLQALLNSADETLPQLAGRFSLLWIDLAKGVLKLAADRFNTYGYCFAREGNRLSFADRANQVPAQRLEIDRQCIFDYFYFHVIPAPETIFKDITRLEPGAQLVADARDTRVSHWWRPTFAPQAACNFDSAASTFKSLILGAVEREMDGTPVAAFLSGGTDSSTVVGMMSRTGNPITAYSIGFEAEGYDEMEFARIAAKHFNVPHRPYYITPQDLVSYIPGVAASYDQPFGNSSVLPAYLCARLAKEDGHAKIFAGDGGDELFGGNTRYAKQRVFAYYDRVPGALKAGVLEPLLTSSPLGKLPGLKKAASYIEQARTPLPDRTDQYNLLYRLGMSTVFHPDFLAGIDTAAPLELQRRVWQEVQAESLVNKMLGFDWRFTLADNDLPKVIGSTGLAGLEVVFPMLDDDLLDFSARLPNDYKLKGLKLRWFFKEALKDFLPADIITKKKQGFGLPFGHWTLKNKALESLARQSVQPLIDEKIIRPDFVDTLFNTHLPAYPGYYGEMVWIMMMMGQWLLQHKASIR